MLRALMRAVVVLPSYNEAENVLPLSADVLSRDGALEVLVVDDNSPDGTGELVEDARRSEPRLHLLRRPGKLGLGSAYLAGFRAALDLGADLILTMDCDYSHHPRYLPAVLAAMKHADVVVGSRYVSGGGVANWPLRRRILSRFANAYTRVLLRLPVHDCTAGFRCYTREVIETVDPFSIRNSGYSFLEEMVNEHEDRVMLRRALAEQYRQAGQNESAIAQLDAIGEMLVEEGKNEEAANTIQQILLLNPPNADGYRQLLKQLQAR